MRQGNAEAVVLRQAEDFLRVGQRWLGADAHVAPDAGHGQHDGFRQAGQIDPRLAANDVAAAKGDGWISGGVAVDRLPEDISTLNALRKAAGLDKRPFEIIANVGPNLDLIKRLRDIGVTSIFNLPAPEELAGSCSLQQKIADSCRYSDEIIAKL